MACTAEMLRISESAAQHSARKPVLFPQNSGTNSCRKGSESSRRQVVISEHSLQLSQIDIYIYIGFRFPGRGAV